MCANCGKECCKVVITKQGERGPQGPVGPPGRNGTDADLDAENVKNAESTALGWFKQKLNGVLQFFSASGSDSIFVEQDTDEIKFSIKETDLQEHTVQDADITSSKFTISTIDAKAFSYKQLHNKMVYFTGTIGFTGDFTGITGTYAIDAILANLPIDIASNDLDIVYLQLTGTTQQLLNVRAQASGTQISFSRSDYAFTNGNTYSVYISFSGTKRIN